MFSIQSLAALALMSGSALAAEHVHKREPAVAYVTVDNTVYVTAQGAVPTTSVAAEVKSSAISSESEAASSSVTSSKTTSVESVSSSSGSSSSVSSSASSSAASASASSTTVSTGSGSAGSLGITYSPYANDGTCKSESQVASDLAQLTGYDVIRIYAVDCDQVPNVYKNLASGQKLFLGVFDMSAITEGCNSIAEGISNDWDVVHTISIGNELVNGGAATVSEVSDYVSSARSTLRSLGYTGPVTTTDTFIATINNPGLCDVGDYVTVNAHAYFDGNVVAEDAGKWVLQQIQEVSATCSGKQTLITESGWPHQGESNGKCVASVANQEAAIASIKSECGDDVLLFTAFNDLWKSPGSYAAEQYWGIYGDSN